MMRAMTVAALVLAAAPATPQNEELQQKLQVFDAFARERRLKNTVRSMSYAIVKDGRIVAVEGIGWQDDDAEEPTTPDTSYLVASITKTFTGATLLAMEAAGVIDLDDDFTTLSDWKARCDWLSGSGLVFAFFGLAVRYPARVRTRWSGCLVVTLRRRYVPSPAFCG
jgi:CubicO group peptidase (beta-lactamase class C family)